MHWAIHRSIVSAPSFRTNRSFSQPVEEGFNVILQRIASPR
jgi:hypothetical protein